MPGGETTSEVSHWRASNEAAAPAAPPQLTFLWSAAWQCRGSVRSSSSSSRRRKETLQDTERQSPTGGSAVGSKPGWKTCGTVAPALPGSPDPGSGHRCWILQEGKGDDYLTDSLCSVGTPPPLTCLRDSERKRMNDFCRLDRVC